MGVLTNAVDWWQEWQLRILVLTSMAVQVLLFIFSSLRRFAIPGWARSITWLAYLAGDAVAIYALATLFNRHKEDHGGDGGSNIVDSTLEVVWAPVLLLHLGGQDGITAYNIEDNELWSRHLLTAVSQVTVAIYVFCKSWPPGGDKRLLAAAVLWFIPGVLKCFVKPWALKSASIYSLISSDDDDDGVERFVDKDAIYSLEEYVKQAKQFVARVQQRQQERPLGHKEHDDNVVVATSAPVEDTDLSKSQGLLCAQLRNYWQSIKEKKKDKLDKRTQENRKVLQELGPLMEAKWEEQTLAFADDQSASQDLFAAQLLAIRRRLLVLGEASYKLFVDLSSPYRLRLSILKYCWVISQGRAYGNVERWLASAFLRLYTKLKTAIVLTENDLAPANDSAPALLLVWCRRLIYYCSRLVLPLVSIGLFHHSHSKAHNNIDVNVTYAIFCCTAVLEICSILTTVVVVVASWESVYSSRESEGNWPAMVAQYSLIGYFASKKKHSSWMCIAGILKCKDFVDQRILCMKPCSSSARISGLVLGYLKAGWKEEIHDAPSYRRFNDHSSRWVLVRKAESSCWGWVLERNLNQCSSQVPDMRRALSFDECVLIWHIATDICFFLSPTVSEHRHMCAFAEVRTAWKKITSWLEFLTSNNQQQQQQQQHQCGQELTCCRAVLCRQMSNYMAYLLFVNPEMLLPGTRRNLFTDAYYELSYILGDMDNNDVKEDEERVTKRVIDTLRERSSRSMEAKARGRRRSTNEQIDAAWAPVLDAAWALVQMLVLDDEKNSKWEEISSVWVEMLCFSASRCRGYLHAKALGQGGEFLSYVWLTLFHMGMETFTDKLKREQEPPSHEAGSNDTAEPTREVSITTTSMDRLQREHLPSQGGNQYGTASTSEIRQVAADVA